MPNSTRRAPASIREQADQALFDDIAARYARKDAVPSSALARQAQLLSAIKPLLDRSLNLGTVVDIGCGIGAAANYLRGHYERYIGIDQSPEMIARAKVFNRHCHQAEFLAENVKSRALLTDVADLVISIGALHHMTDLDGVMHALIGIAKPGAHLVVIEPQNGNPLIQMMRWIRGIVDTSYSTEQIFFSETDLRALFTDHNLGNLVVDFQGFFTPPFAQVVMQPQTLTVPLCRAAIRADAWLHRHLPRWLGRLSFNIVATGQFAGETR
jgi:SAM-dependent methyltransferase